MFLRRMSDTFQTIVDIEVSLTDAPIIANRMLAWLIQQDIVAAMPSHCILGSDSAGYAPVHYQKVTESDPATTNLDKLAVNGLEICAGRRVFCPTSDVVVQCPHCHTDCGDSWQDAVDSWYSRQQVGMLQCTNCGQQAPITAWHFDPVWGFGNLGFTFWNWPPLSQRFRSAFDDQLGHRTVFISSKI